VRVNVDEARREDTFATIDDDRSDRSLESSTGDHPGDLVSHDEHVPFGQVGVDTVKDPHVAKKNGRLLGRAGRKRNQNADHQANKNHESREPKAIHDESPDR
jgi:hypothetical protein